MGRRCTSFMGRSDTHKKEKSMRCRLSAEKARRRPTGNLPVVPNSRWPDSLHAWMSLFKSYLLAFTMYLFSCCRINRHAISFSRFLFLFLAPQHFDFYPSFSTTTHCCQSSLSAHAILPRPPSP